MSPEGRGLYVWHLSHSCISSTPISLVHSTEKPRSRLALCCTPGFLSTLHHSGPNAELARLALQHVCPGCSRRVQVRVGIDANASGTVRQPGRTLHPGVKESSR